MEIVEQLDNDEKHFEELLNKYERITDYKADPTAKELRKLALSDGIDGDYSEAERQRDPTTPLKRKEVAPQKGVEQR